MPAALEIRLLGPFRVSVQGETVDESRWARKKARTLVKLLALEPGRELLRDVLIERLWPELDAEQGLNNFHKTLHAARRALEPDLKPGAVSAYLVTQDQKVALRAPGELFIDADEFEKRARASLASGDPGDYAAALELYAGELLAEDRYEDWASVRRDKLANLHQEVLVRYAALRESHGAIELLEQAVAAIPGNENAHRQLMRLHALAGNRHLAIAQYRQCAEALRRDLDAEPEAATQRLYEEIQAGLLGPSAPEAPVGEPAAKAAEPATPVRRHWSWALVAGLLAVTLALGGAWYYTRSGERIESLAVLPFTSDAGVSQDYLADGLTEGLINALSQARPLRVMARSTVFTYKGKTADPRAVGRAIGVRAVLTGHIAQRDRNLAVSIEVVDTRDGAQIWGAQYTFETTGLSAAQSRLATEVAAALSLRPRDTAYTRVATRDPRAYDFYLRGRWHWNQRTDAGYQKAIEYFDQAIAVDPGYALAFAGLADSYGLLGWQSAPPRAYLPKARSMALQALALDDKLAEGHTSLGMIKALYDWDWRGAEAEFRRAIELNPGYATAHHWLAVHLNGQGRHDEARAAFARALELDPLSRIINVNAAYPDYYQGRLDLAIKAYRKVIDLDPGFVTAHEDLAVALEQAGREAEAAAEVGRYLTAAGEPALAERFRQAVRARGYRAGLETWLTEILTRANASYVSPIEIAQLYVRSGNTAKAFEWLERAFDERSAPLVYLRADPLYAPLRPDPRYRSLLDRLGL